MRTQTSNFKFQNRILAFCLLPFAVCLFSCGSVPNLEKAECTESRNTVREFYSIHFGNSMKPSAEYLKLRERFLTGSLKSSFSNNFDGERDYFTQTENYPKAFRVGECQVIAPEKTVFSVLLFWKSDESSEQREVKVETIKENGNWLINKVY